MPGADIARPPIHRITLAQLALLLPLCLVLAGFDRVCAYSLASGGLVAIIPQAWFAHVAFRHRGAQDARAIARSGYVGEVGKFVLSAACFAALFVWVRPIEGMAVFAGYLVMLAVQIAGGWLQLRRGQ